MPELVSQRGQPHAPLPWARLEVESLARLVPGTSLLVGSRASEQNLEQLARHDKLRHFRLIHLATHGEINPGQPRESALILAQDHLPPLDERLQAVLSGRKLPDGRLTVDTVLRSWKLDADLVVLSACQTGLGHSAGGDGLLGFTHAFLARGARAVLLSRWKVDDSATALLMVRFYENLLGKRAGLKKPLGRAEALAEAKSWLRALSRREAGALAARLAGGKLRGPIEPPLAEVNGKAPKLPEGDRPFAAPACWAGFVLIGDPS
jgi:CHAT domain-containing protein